MAKRCNRRARHRAEDSHYLTANLYNLNMGSPRELGELVRSIRKQRKWTQKYLADMAGTSSSWVSNIETAYVDTKKGYSRPSDEVLNGIAKAFGIPVGKLHAALGRGVEPTALPELVSIKVRDIAAKASRLPDEQQDAILRLVESMSPNAGLQC